MLFDYLHKTITVFIRAQSVLGEKQDIRAKTKARSHARAFAMFMAQVVFFHLIALLIMAL